MENIDQELFESLNEILTQIAQKNLGIQTLKEQNSDSMDFHEVSVSQVKDALMAAFVSGVTVAETVSKLA